MFMGRKANDVGGGVGGGSPRHEKQQVKSRANATGHTGDGQGYAPLLLLFAVLALPGRPLCVLLRLPCFRPVVVVLFTSSRRAFASCGGGRGSFVRVTWCHVVVVTWRRVMWRRLCFGASCGVGVVALV